MLRSTFSLKKSLLFWFSISIFCSTVSWGKTSAYPVLFPKALIYKKHFISPNCLFSMENREASFSLPQCNQLEKGQKITGINPFFNKKGYVGYDFLWRTDPDLPAWQGFHYYKFIGQYGKNLIVQDEYNGGGSGTFSTLVRLQRQSNLLQATTLVSGDRCNGGIFYAKLLGSKLVYRTYITPADFLSLSNMNPHHLEPYQDLSGCAACCVGSALFVQDLERASSPRFVSIRIDAKALQNFVEPSSLQACFDQQIFSYRKQGITVLDENALKKFMQAFSKKCVKEE